MPRRFAFISFRRARLLVLIGLLTATVAWAAGTEQRRRARTRWERPLRVGVVLLTREGTVVHVDHWRRGLDALSSRLDAEMRRWRGAGEPPFQLELVGPARWDGAFPLSPLSDRFADRALYAFGLWRVLWDIDGVAGVVRSDWDVRLYVLGARTPAWGGSFAEGVGARYGDVALVRGSVGGDLSLPLQVIGHELLHTVGASDKYDDGGHALEPEGLVEPERAPRYPQLQAEWMAGEVPVSLGAGKPPSSLDDLGVGPVTAQEIGWTSPVRLASSQHPVRARREGDPGRPPGSGSGDRGNWLPWPGRH
jgi:hypothetical protein